MHFGEIEVRHIRGGHFYLDGGAMFGVIPRPLWEKKSTPDTRNRIRLAANSLLVRTARQTILIETGNGTIWSPKLRDIYGIDEGDPLSSNLAAAGVWAGAVDLVINTHLHFDHAGGNTRLHEGKIAPTFPNARYIVQSGELAHAAQPTERDRASYFEDHFRPVERAGQWQTVCGDSEILPGIAVERIAGHNADIQAVRIAGGGKSLVLVADLIPTRHHLPLPWIMAYDLYPLQTLETKRKWIQSILRDGSIVVFGHDPDVPAATLHDLEGKIEFEPVDLNR